MVDFINTNTGTQRLVGGLLNHEVARIAECDEAVAGFVGAGASEKDFALKKVLECLIKCLGALRASLWLL